MSPGSKEPEASSVKEHVDRACCGARSTATGDGRGLIVTWQRRKFAWGVLKVCSVVLMELHRVRCFGFS